MPEEPLQPVASTPTISEADKKAGKEILKDVREELDRLASRLQVPGVGRVDRRFPVYVVFTTRKGLENQYGSQTCFILDELLKQVVESVRKKPGWTSILYYADDTACTTALGVKPAPFNDAWKLKLAIADLDKALSKRGEMIGSLLIVGGPEVVPFHLLPNPTDDADTQVASDNPYASTDDNYFIPEWPVGRLPGGTNRDAGILMQYLRKMIINHSQQVIPQPWWRQSECFLSNLEFNAAYIPICTWRNEYTANHLVILLLFGIRHLLRLFAQSAIHNPCWLLHRSKPDP